jgi:hypothetical protein
MGFKNWFYVLTYAAGIAHIRDTWKRRPLGRIIIYFGYFRGSLKTNLKICEHFIRLFVELQQNQSEKDSVVLISLRRVSDVTVWQ